MAYKYMNGKAKWRDSLSPQLLPSTGAPTLISIPEEFMHSLSCVYIYAEKE